jgi:hypothetical protein
MLEIESSGKGTPMSHALQQFEATLEQHVRFVREGARTPEAWKAVAAFYGLPPPASASGPVSVPEMVAALLALVLQAARHLETIPVDEDDQERVEALWNRLVGLVDDEGQAYEASLAPRAAKLGLASIFENATASVGKHAWSNWKMDRRLVLLCKTCGAAQEKTRDFRCSYCRGDLFRRGGDRE